MKSMPNSPNLTHSQNQILLYRKAVRIPDIVWSRSHIQIMIDTLNASNDYQKNIWGDWMKARDKLILMMQYEHALRPREVCKLRFDDFNMMERTIKIQARNNKQKKERVVPICKNIKPHLDEYFNFPSWMWKGSPYIFPSFQNEHLSSERWKSIFREKILKPSGLWIKPIAPSFSKTRSYTLRHSRATELINKSKDIYLVANVLGHSDISSTTCYLHKTKEYMDYVRACLN